jgi:hypothetical protein
MYSLHFADEALEELGLVPVPLDRRKVLAAIQCLTACPESLGVAEAIDAGGRTNRIGVLGRIAFVYWADHALRQLRILAVQTVAD